MSAEAPHQGLERRFVVVLRASSAVKFRPDGALIIRRLGLPTGPTDFALRTRHVDEGFEAPVPRELWVDVRGPAPSLREAIDTFTAVARSLTASLAFAANAQVEELSVELAYEITPGVREREFFQSFIPDERGVPRLGRRPDADATVKLIMVINSHRDAGRLRRAIGQYYEALQSSAPGRETIALAHLWMGVENLTKVAIRALCAGHGLTEDDVDGLARALRVERRDLDPFARREVIFHGDAESYREAKGASDAFEHGFMEFHEVHSLAAAARDRVAAHLRRAILELCGLDATTRETLLGEQFATAMGSWRFMRYLRGKLISDSDELAAEGQEYPIFRWDSRIKSSSFDAEGRHHVAPVERLTARLAEGVTFTGGSYEVWGPNPGPSEPIETAMEVTMAAKPGPARSARSLPSKALGLLGALRRRLLAFVARGARRG